MPLGKDELHKIEGLVEAMFAIIEQEKDPDIARVAVMEVLAGVLCTCSSPTKAFRECILMIAQLPALAEAIESESEADDAIAESN